MWAVDCYFPELVWNVYKRKPGEESSFTHASYHEYVIGYKTMIRLTGGQGSVLRNCFLREQLCEKSQLNYGSQDNHFIHLLPGKLTFFVPLFV